MREYRLDLANAGAEFFGRGIEVAREISGIVDQIDEVLPNHAPPGIEDGERELLAQHVRQGGFGGDKRFQIVVAVLAASRSDAGPVRVGARKVGIAARAGRFGVIPRAVGRRVLMLVAGRAVLAAARGPGLAIHDGWIGRVGCLGCLGCGGSGCLGLGPAIQQGIALEFGFYVGDKVKIGQL